MDAAALPTIPLLALSRTLMHSNPYRFLLRPTSPRCFSSPLHLSPSSFLSPRRPTLFASISCFSETAAPGGGDDGNGVSGGDGGESGGGSGGGETVTNPAPTGDGEDVSALGTDVIILDVGGMSCGGCAASVKRILESQPQVSSADVNLATETAIVRAVPEAKVAQNWKQQLGEKLATHLTTCGFKSNLRGPGQDVGGAIS